MANFFGINYYVNVENHFPWPFFVHFSYKYFVGFSCTNSEYDRKGIHGPYQSVLLNFSVALSCPISYEGFWNWTGRSWILQILSEPTSLVRESLIVWGRVWCWRRLVQELISVAALLVTPLYWWQFYVCHQNFKWFERKDFWFCWIQ